MENSGTSNTPSSVDQYHIGSWTLPRRCSLIGTPGIGSTTVTVTKLTKFRSPIAFASDVVSRRRSVCIAPYSSERIDDIAGYRRALAGATCAAPVIITTGSSANGGTRSKVIQLEPVRIRGCSTPAGEQAASTEVRIRKRSFAERIFNSRSQRPASVQLLRKHSLATVYFTVIYDFMDGFTDRQTVPAIGGLTIGQAIRSRVEYWGRNLDNILLFLPCSSTPVPLTSDCSCLVNALLQVTAKESLRGRRTSVKELVKREGTECAELPPVRVIHQLHGSCSALNNFAFFDPALTVGSEVTDVHNNSHPISNNHQSTQRIGEVGGEGPGEGRRGRGDLAGGFSVLEKGDESREAGVRESGGGLSCHLTAEATMFSPATGGDIQQSPRWAGHTAAAEGEISARSGGQASSGVDTSPCRGNVRQDTTNLWRAAEQKRKGSGDGGGGGGGGVGGGGISGGEGDAAALLFSPTTPVKYNKNMTRGGTSRLQSLFSSPFTKTHDRTEQLNEILQGYSVHGLPKLPDLYAHGRPHYDSTQFHLERHWSDVVANPDSLTKRQRDQQEGIWEMLTTEVEYIRKLRVIIDLFMACLLNLQHHQILTEIKAESLFGNIIDVYYATCLFWDSHLSQTVRQARKTHEPLNPSLLKTGFLVFDKIFEPYTRYCLEQESSREYIKNKIKDFDLFKIYVMWCQAQKQCSRLTLVDLIVRPWQRLTKYKLLLYAILEPTEKMERSPSVEEQRNDIRLTIEQVEAFVSSVNSSMSHTHDSKQLLHVMNRIESYEGIDAPSDECYKLVSEYCKLDLSGPVPGCSDQDTRCLLLEGSLKLKDAYCKMDVHCFLFTDMLLVTKPTAKKGDKVKVVKPPMRLDKIVVFSLRDFASFLLLYLNEYQMAQSVYTLHGNSQLWLDAIHKAQTEYRDKRNSNLARSDLHIGNVDSLSLLDATYDLYDVMTTSIDNDEVMTCRLRPSSAEPPRGRLTRQNSFGSADVTGCPPTPLGSTLSVTGGGIHRSLSFVDVSTVSPLGRSGEVGNIRGSLQHDKQRPHSAVSTPRTTMASRSPSSLDRRRVVHHPGTAVKDQYLAIPPADSVCGCDFTTSEPRRSHVTSDTSSTAYFTGQYDDEEVPIFGAECGVGTVISLDEELFEEELVVREDDEHSIGAERRRKSDTVQNSRATASRLDVQGGDVTSGDATHRTRLRERRLARGGVRRAGGEGGAGERRYNTADMIYDMREAAAALEDYRGATVTGIVKHLSWNSPGNPSTISSTDSSLNSSGFTLMKPLAIAPDEQLNSTSKDENFIALSSTSLTGTTDSDRDNLERTVPNELQQENLEFSRGESVGDSSLQGSIEWPSSRGGSVRDNSQRGSVVSSSSGFSSGVSLGLSRESEICEETEYELKEDLYPADLDSCIRNDDLGSRVRAWRIRKNIANGQSSGEQVTGANSVTGSEMPNRIETADANTQTGTLKYSSVLGGVKVVRESCMQTDTLRRYPCVINGMQMRRTLSLPDLLLFTEDSIRSCRRFESKFACNISASFCRENKNFICPSETCGNKTSTCTDKYCENNNCCESKSPFLATGGQCGVYSNSGGSLATNYIKSNTWVKEMMEEKEKTLNRVEMDNRNDDVGVGVEFRNDINPEEVDEDDIGRPDVDKIQRRRLSPLQRRRLSRQQLISGTELRIS